MKRAGDLLGAFFDGDVIRKAQGYSEFFSSWNNLVGDRLGAHSKVVELDRNVLIVEAEHPGWIQLLQMKQADILRKVQAKYPDFHITGVSFRLKREGSPLPQRPSPREEAPPRVVEAEPPAPEGSPKGDPYATIADESFKERLKSLERSIRTRDQEGRSGSR